MKSFVIFKTMKNFLKEKHEFIKSLREEKKTYKEIGRIMNISRQRVHQIFKNYRNDLPAKIKKYIFNKYNNKCAGCLSSKSLHIHHIDKNKKNDKLENLILLCVNCHKEIHRELNGKFEQEPKFYKGRTKLSKICPACKKEFFIFKGTKNKFCGKKCFYNSIRLSPEIKRLRFGLSQRKYQKKNRKIINLKQRIRYYQRKNKT